MASSQCSSSSNDYLSGCKEVKDRESHVQFSKDEVALMVRMYKLVGQRWGLIAGRIPGRSAEEIEKYWASNHCKGCFSK